MNRPRTPFLERVARSFPPEAWAVAVWIFFALLWPEEKLALGLIGGSPGSTSSGINFFWSELGIVALSLWILAQARFRRRIPGIAYKLAGLWSLLIVLAALRGLLHGSAPRDIAAEGRLILAAPAGLVLAALDAPGRRLARWAVLAGALAWALWQGALVLAEPLGFLNLNIVPVRVSASEHGLHLQWLSALAALLAGGLCLPALPGFLLAAGLWVLLWLSLLRGLWVGWAAGVLVAGALLVRSRGWKRGAVFVLVQGLALLAGLWMTLAVHRASYPDGDFLLRFRLQRLAQALHLAPAPPLTPDPGPLASAGLRALIARGGLYYITPKPEAVKAARKVDPSVGERALMIRLALDVFRRSPVLGQGLGLVLKVPTDDGFKMQRDPHNGPAWFAAKTGLLGLAFVVLCAGLVARALWRRRDGGVWTAAFGGAVMMALTLDLAQPGVLHISVWLPLFALATVLLETGPA